MTGTERIFGTWDTPRVTGEYLHDHLQGIFHSLAAQNVGTPQFEPNSGLSQKKDQFIMMCALFSMIKPQVIMEVGVAQGATLSAWCQLAPPDAMIIALDKDLNDARPRPGDPVHSSIYHGPLKMTSDGGGIYSLKQKGQKMVGVNGWTSDPRVQAEVVQHLNGRKVDWLFHDCSHSARMTREDMIWMWPLVADGGCLVLHDIQPSKHPDCDKCVAWREMLDTLDYSAHYELIGNRESDSMGVGILVR